VSTGRWLGPTAASCAGDAGRQQLGHAGARGSALYRGAGREGPLGAHAQAGRRQPAVAPSASGQWASRGPGGLERVGASGSARKGRIGFFF
jgi:hypothetical protein